MALDRGPDEPTGDGSEGTRKTETPQAQRAEEELVSRITANREATMNQVVSSSAAKALLPLIKRYWGVPLHEITKEEGERRKKSCVTWLQALKPTDFFQESEEEIKKRPGLTALYENIKDNLSKAIQSMTGLLDQPVTFLDQVTLQNRDAEDRLQEEQVTLPLSIVLSTIIDALNDDQRFVVVETVITKPKVDTVSGNLSPAQQFSERREREKTRKEAKERVDKAHAEQPLRYLSLFNALCAIKEGICSHGARNALILLLNGTYEGIHIIEEAEAEIRAFYKERLQEAFKSKEAALKASEDPHAQEDLKGLHQAFLEWMEEDSNAVPLKELVDPDHLIQAELKALFLKHGIDAEAFKIQYMGETMPLMAVFDKIPTWLPFSSDDPNERLAYDLLIADDQVKNQKSRNDALKAVQRWIRTEWVQHRKDQASLVETPDGLRHPILQGFSTLYEAHQAFLQSQSLLTITCHLSEEEANIFLTLCETHFKAIAAGTPLSFTLSDQDKATIEQIKAKIKAVKEDTMVKEITNFFALWFQGEDRTKADLYIKLFLNEHFQSRVFLSDEMIQFFNKANTQVEGGTSVRNITPYELNRILLHAMLVKPEEWGWNREKNQETPFFEEAFNRALQFIEGPLSTGSLGEAFKSTSYPEELIDYLKYLKKRRELHKSNLVNPDDPPLPRPRGIPFLPSDMKRAEDWLSITNLLKDNYPAEWERIYRSNQAQIDNLLYKYIKDDEILGRIVGALLVLPENARVAALGVLVERLGGNAAFQSLVQNGDDLASILKVLPENTRAAQLDVLILNRPDYFSKLKENISPAQWSEFYQRFSELNFPFDFEKPLSGSLVPPIADILSCLTEEQGKEFYNSIKNNASFKRGAESGCDLKWLLTLSKDMPCHAVTIKNIILEILKIQLNNSRVYVYGEKDFKSLLSEIDLSRLITNAEEFNRAIASLYDKEEANILYKRIGPMALIKMIHSADDFRNIVSKLEEALKDEIYDLFKKEKESIFKVLIHTMEDFENVMRGITDEKFSNILEDAGGFLGLILSLSITSEGAFHILIWDYFGRLTGEQRATFLEEITALTSDFFSKITFASTSDLLVVLKYASPDQCKIICEKLDTANHLIPKLFDGMYGLNATLQALNPEQCSAVCGVLARSKSGFSTNIKSFDELNYAFTKYVDEPQRRAACIFLTSQGDFLEKIIENPYQMKTILSWLTPEECEEVGRNHSELLRKQLKENPLLEGLTASGFFKLEGLDGERLQAVFKGMFTATLANSAQVYGDLQSLFSKSSDNSWHTFLFKPIAESLLPLIENQDIPLADRLNYIGFLLYLSPASCQNDVLSKIDLRALIDSGTNFIYVLNQVAALTSIFEKDKANSVLTESACALIAALKEQNISLKFNSADLVSESEGDMNLGTLLHELSKEWCAVLLPPGSLSFSSLEDAEALLTDLEPEQCDAIYPAFQESLSAYLADAGKKKVVLRDRLFQVLVHFTPETMQSSFEALNVAQFIRSQDDFVEAIFLLHKKGSEYVQVFLDVIGKDRLASFHLPLDALNALQPCLTDHQYEYIKENMTARPGWLPSLRRPARRQSARSPSGENTPKPH